jgi:predicted metal-dependent hydrolase
MEKLSSRRPVTLQDGTISLLGRDISYTVKRSYRARYARLEIRSDTGLTVIIPRRYPVVKIEEFLEQKSKWILKTLDKHCQRTPQSCEILGSGDTVPYLGRDIEITVRPMCEKYVQLSMLGDQLLVSKRINENGFSRLLEMWYRQQAEILFRQKLESISKLLGVRYGRLSIRGQKTRWGSCSRMGTVSLNWKLMMLPEPVIDYVIIHELIHLKEMNHSKQFWQIVDRYCPEWKEHRSFLRDHRIENFNVVTSA